MLPILTLEVEKGLTVRGALAPNTYAGGRERVNSEGRVYCY